MKMPIETFVRRSAWSCLVLVCFSLLAYVVQGYLFGHIYISQSILKFVTAALILALIFMSSSDFAVRSWSVSLSSATKGYMLFCLFFSLRMAVAYEFDWMTTAHAIAYSLTLTPLLLVLVDRGVAIKSKEILIGIGLLCALNFLLVYFEFVSGKPFFSEGILNWLYKEDFIKLDNLMGIERYNGLFKRPLEMGIFFGLIFLYTFWRASEAKLWKNQLFFAGAACAAGFLFVVSGIRGVLVSVFAATLYLCCNMGRNELKRGVSVLIGSFLFCVISIGISPYGLSRYLEILLNPTNILNRLVIWARVLGFDISFISFGRFRSTETVENLTRFSLNSLKNPMDILFGKGLIQNVYVSRDLAVSFDSTYLAVIGACGLVGLALFMTAMILLFRYMRTRHAVYGAFMVFMLVGFMGENMLNVFYFPVLLVMIIEGFAQNSFIRIKRTWENS